MGPSHEVFQKGPGLVFPRSKPYLESVVVFNVRQTSLFNFVTQNEIKYILQGFKSDCNSTYNANQEAINFFWTCFTR